VISNGPGAALAFELPPFTSRARDLTQASYAAPAAIVALAAVDAAERAALEHDWRREDAERVLKHESSMSRSAGHLMQVENQQINRAPDVRASGARQARIFGMSLGIVLAIALSLNAVSRSNEPETSEQKVPSGLVSSR
jgi:hypothetical protein